MPTPDDLALWTAALDEYERRLDAQADVVRRAEQGALPTADEVLALTATPPAGLPPLPAELAERAEALLARTHLVQDGLATLIETTRPARAARRLPVASAHRAVSQGLDLRA